MRLRSLKIAAVSLLFLAATAGLNFSQDEGFNPSEMQAQFAQSVESSMSGVENAEWKSPVDFWIESPNATKDNAGTIANDVVAKARTDLKQSLCVHIHNGDWRPLSNMCWTAP